MSTFGALNYVNVGPGGTFRARGGLETTPAQIDALFQHLRTIDASKLVIHFHGGLVAENAGLAVAEKMWTLFKDDAHPLTFVWETGLAETIRANLTSVSSTALFRKVFEYAVRKAAEQLGVAPGGRGAAAPLTLEEIRAEMAAETYLRELDAGARGVAATRTEAELAAEAPQIEVELEVELDSDPTIETILEAEAPSTPLLNESFKTELETEAGRGIISTVVLAKHIAAIVIRVVRRFMRKRDHGVWETTVEETLRELYLADLGAWVWTGMKTAAEQMWLPNDGPIDDNSHLGTYFLDGLAALQQERPGLTVDLIGHSAGSIAICHLLRSAAARSLDLRVRTVIFLAPACTTALLHTEVVTHPERYARFRMFTMRDDLERKDTLVKVAYPRSLLYFVSGVLEGEADHTLAGLERHTLGAAPYDSVELRAVRDFLRADGENRLILSESADLGAGLNTIARTHGGFDDDPTTRESLRQIVAA